MTSFAGHVDGDEKGPGTECVTLTTKYFASAVTHVQDHVLSV